MLPNLVAVTTDTLRTAIHWRRAEPHPILLGAATWCDDHAQRARDDLARNELRHLGLMDGTRLDPDADDVLGALVRPDREFYGWIDTTIDDQPHRYGVLVVAAYQEAVLVIRDHQSDISALLSIRPDQLLDTFIAQLPPAPAPKRASITMAYEEFLRASTHRSENESAHTRQPHHADIETLQRILRQPRLGAGNLYAAIRTRAGRRNRITHPVNFIDTPDGRWMTILDSRVGQHWLITLPATRTHIATRMAERAAALRRTRPN